MFPVQLSRLCLTYILKIHICLPKKAERQFTDGVNKADHSDSELYVKIDS